MAGRIIESDSMYAHKLNELQTDLALARRMTSACYLDRGVSLHWKLDGANTVFAELPAPPAATTDYVLGQRGIPPGIGAKMYVNKRPLDQGDIAAIRAAGGTVSIDESGLPHISLPLPGT
jgi:hypothetical protein